MTRTERIKADESALYAEGTRVAVRCAKARALLGRDRYELRAVGKQPRFSSRKRMLAKHSGRKAA